MTDGLWRVRTTVITWAHKLQDATGLLTSGSSHLIYSVLGYKFWLSTDTLVICSVGVCVSIFRSYDVRGIYGKDIDEGIMKRIGAAFCKVSTKTIVIANDMRVSSESLKRAFISGCNRQVIDCGRVPPVLRRLLANRRPRRSISACHRLRPMPGATARGDG